MEQTSAMDDAMSRCDDWGLLCTAMGHRLVAPSSLPPPPLSPFPPRARVSLRCLPSQSSESKFGWEHVSGTFL